MVMPGRPGYGGYHSSRAIGPRWRGSYRSPYRHGYGRCGYPVTAWAYSGYGVSYLPYTYWSYWDAPYAAWPIAPIGLPADNLFGPWVAQQPVGLAGNHPAPIASGRPVSRGPRQSNAAARGRAGRLIEQGDARFAKGDYIQGAAALPGRRRPPRPIGLRPVSAEVMPSPRKDSIRRPRRPIVAGYSSMMTGPNRASGGSRSMPMTRPPHRPIATHWLIKWPSIRTTPISCSYSGSASTLMAKSIGRGLFFAVPSNSVVTDRDSTPSWQNHSPRPPPDRNSNRRRFPLIRCTDDARFGNRQTRQASAGEPFERRGQDPGTPAVYCSPLRCYGDRWCFNSL